MFHKGLAIWTRTSSFREEKSVHKTLWEEILSYRTIESRLKYTTSSVSYVLTGALKKKSTKQIGGQRKLRPKLKMVVVRKARTGHFTSRSFRNMYNAPVRERRIQ